PKQTISRKGLEIQSIDEWTIAFRKRALANEIDEVSGLHERARKAAAETTASAEAAASPGVAPNDRHTWVFISCILAAIPELPRRAADNPRADVTRRAI